jgi:ATP-dependent Clp protease ATP-binding subunit ClpB
MAIRWDKFTVKSQEAIQHASELASQHGNPELLPVHVLVALTQDREGIVVPVLSKLGANPATIEAQAMERVEALPKVSGSGATQAHLSSEMQKVLDQAFKEADKFKDEYVSTEHLLLALTQSKGNEAQKILAAAGANWIR